MMKYLMAVFLLSLKVSDCFFVSSWGGGRHRYIAYSHQLLHQVPVTTSSDGPGDIKLSNKACTGTLGGFNVVAEEVDLNDAEVQRQALSRDASTIRLLNVGAGWGNGAHPTTRLCFEFLKTHVAGGETVLDYGTGSGILAILAAKVGAQRVVAVDIDDDTLVAAEKNAVLNGVAHVLDVTHTRYVYVGEDRFPPSDITVANILPGALSMLAPTLWGLTRPGGLLCVSGLRPHELPAIQRIYGPYVDRTHEEVRQEVRVGASRKEKFLPCFALQCNETPPFPPKPTLSSAVARAVRRLGELVRADQGRAVGRGEEEDTRRAYRSRHGPVTRVCVPF